MQVRLGMPYGRSRVVKQRERGQRHCYKEKRWKIFENVRKPYTNVQKPYTNIRKLYGNIQKTTQKRLNI
jgi:hypothetical protein